MDSQRETSVRFAETDVFFAYGGLAAFHKPVPTVMVGVSRRAARAAAHDSLYQITISTKLIGRIFSVPFATAVLIMFVEYVEFACKDEMVGVSGAD